MNRFVLSMFGFFILFTCGISVAEDKEHDHLVKELMSKSGLVKQVGSIPDQIQGTLVQTQQQRGSLSQAQFEELTGMMIAAYDANKLATNVELHINQNLTSTDIRSILQWLNTDLGKKITHYEEEASTGEAMIKIQEIAASLENQDSNRLEKVTRLDDIVKATDSTVIMVQGIQIAMTMGIMSGMPQKEQMTIEALTKMVKGNSAQLHAGLRPQILASMLYSYRDLSIAEIDQYIKFASTKSADKYHGVTMSALAIAMSKASQGLGDSIFNAKERLSAKN